MYDDAYTRNDDGELAVRTVSTSGDNNTNKDDVFTRDDEGRLAMRTVGGSGGGGGMTQVRHDDTLKGKGTSAEPLGISDEVMQKIEQGGGGDFVPQYDTMPTASADNVGEVVQYSGETIPGVEESATILQTVGSGLTSLSVNLETFVGAEQPTGNETVDFVALDEGAAASITQNPDGETVTIINADLFVNWIEQRMAYLGLDINDWLTGCIHWNGAEWYLFDINMQSNIGGGDSTFWEGIGVEIVGAPTGSSVDAVYEITSFGGISWTKNSQTVDLSGYGISYSGTPNNGDTLTVAYTAPVAGITNGYFYANQPTYTDPSATISQTVGQADSISFETTVGNIGITNDTTTPIRNLAALYGWTFSSGTLTITHTDENNWDIRGEDQTHGFFQSGWSNEGFYGLGFVISGEPQVGDTVVCTYTLGNIYDLSVDVDTFVEAEQPTQSGNTSFVANVTEDSVSLYNKTSYREWEVSVEPSVFVATFARELQIPISTISGEGDCYIVLGADTYNPSGWAIVFPGGWLSILNIEDWGFTITGEPGKYDQVYILGLPGSTTWSKNGTTVDLANYGISYSGTPANGDTLTVAYTAPVITGYAWNQINVQPGSDGGNAGIEWKTKVDLPAEYTGNEGDAAAYFTIAGGLPDGEYEFYYSVKSKVSSAYPVGERIYKVRIILDSQNNTAYGQMGYVFDGDYMNNSNRADCLNSRTLYNCVKKNGSDFILYLNDWLSTDILSYNNHQAVAECFKLSAIKNVATGQEYVTVGAINLDGSAPQYTGEFSSEVMLAPLGQQPYIPSKTTVYATPISGFENNTIRTSSNAEYYTLTMEHPVSGSVFVVEYTGAYRNGTLVPYAQKILKSTGVFAGCYLATGDNYVYVMGVDTTAVATMSGYVNVSLGVLSNEAPSTWFEAIPQNTTPVAQAGPQGSRLGTITYDGLGNIVQYTGETNANYTNGYFYKATGTVVSVPASISFINVNPNDVTVTVANPDALITALNSVGGWGEQWVRDRLSLDYTEFRIDYNFDTGTIVRVWWSYYGDIYNQDVLNCFAVSTTGSYTGEVTVIFACDRGYVPESKGVQNQSWERVDIQPSSGGGSTSATASLTVAGWSNNSQTVNVTGVTANNNVIVAPAPASASDYASAGILCEAQAAGSLTFTCTTVPSSAITVNVLII